jgi:hypothetical protein
MAFEDGESAVDEVLAADVPPTAAACLALRDLPGAIAATNPAKAAVRAAVPAIVHLRTRLARATATSRSSAASL